MNGPGICFRQIDDSPIGLDPKVYNFFLLCSLLYIGNVRNGQVLSSAPVTNRRPSSLELPEILLLCRLLRGLGLSEPPLDSSLDERVRRL
jgi:hypothetical protein